MYEGEQGEPIFTKAAAKYNDSVNNKLYELIKG